MIGMALGICYSTNTEHLIVKPTLYACVKPRFMILLSIMILLYLAYGFTFVYTIENWEQCH